MPASPLQPGPFDRLRRHLLAITTLTFLGLFLLAVGALLWADLSYVNARVLWTALQSPRIQAAMRLTAWTSTASLALIVLFSIPVGYALSRYRFPGHSWVVTLVTLPIVLPPLVVGVSLLVFFATPPGRFIEAHLLRFVYTVPGIVLCQFMVSASYGIRASQAAFDAVDVRLEQLARTLGCTAGGAFRRVALPLARNGLVAAAILAWAHSVGLFGPLVVFAGAVAMKTEVMPTTIFLELTVGHIDVALAVAIVMLAMATAALLLAHRLGPGRRWWQ